ncbi:restriction endonuclease [Polyangium sorediatum]|uniref:Restriction endonuclease n=1 Tax=Polyangium sorediatum TaxID=889274 RepID=A0ABT6P2U5_9BACT|nr:restriction endonuclease [Polyangium sorediatum]MDI1434925.1 restriction endonuclease [Polyangium sorediatum]
MQDLSTATLSELVLKLQRPGVDMFEQQLLRGAITQRGVDAARELLNFIAQDAPLVEGLLRDTLKGIRDEPARERIRNELERRIEPNHEPPVRRVCMRLLGTHFPQATHVGARLLDFAASSATETRDMRMDALKATVKFLATATLGSRMVRLLDDADPSIVAEVLNALPAYQPVLEPRDVVGKLHALVSLGSTSEIKYTAIELLGRFGDIDAFERVCLQPLHHERERLAVQIMVGHLLSKPRNVLALAPKTFELLVKQLLEKMGYEGVEEQNKGSCDGGVDVTAWTTEVRVNGPQRVKVVVQCKRYSPSNLVGADVVRKMVDSLRAQGAARGVIITTSAFQPAALEFHRDHQYIELINGQQLQTQLDTYFEGTFRVGELAIKASRST